MGVLQVGLLILAVERVLRVAVLEALALQQLVQQLVDFLLVIALVVLRAVRLPLLQRLRRVSDRLPGLVAGICQRILHILAAVQPCGRVAVGRIRRALGPGLRLHGIQRLFLFLFVCHNFSFLL